MLDVDLDIGNNQLFECLGVDSVIPLEDVSKESDIHKNFIGDVLIEADQAAAFEAAESLLNSGSSPKKKTRRLPKIQKLSTAKRRKMK